ncbi:MAG TPA: hypothetical protein VHC21_00785 [Candidatus Saccharimonadales bacterium]|nr:hypothetical protein [Candidatus Saccharimonadales bacterium]
MRRILTSLFIFFSLFLPALSFAGSAGAANIFNNVCSGNGSGSSTCQSVQAQQNKGNDNPIIDIIRVAINVISYIIGVAAIVGLIVNAIRLIVSGGDSNAAASARSGIIACLIGVAIATLALVIVNLVIGN